jgi:3-isopropylmalate/(R)-2-methylmalate dehydratase small subunit
MKLLKGVARKVGDHVDTDAIIPARYCTSIDPQELGSHVLEGLDPYFSQRILPGDVLVAGKNFGSGSAREHAAIAIYGAGVAAVIANSFSRTFFRNAINVALPVLECEHVQQIHDGDSLEIDLQQFRILNKSTGEQYKATPYPEIIGRILNSGGMIGFARLELEKRKKAKGSG